jgi:hypothetical protein
MQQEWFKRSAPLRTAIVRQQVFFPDRRLIQFDCGKLQARAYTAKFIHMHTHDHSHCYRSCHSATVWMRLCLLLAAKLQVQQV